MLVPIFKTPSENLNFSTEFKYIPSPFEAVPPDLMLPILHASAYQLKLSNLTGLSIEIEGAVIVMALLSVAEARFTVPVFDIFVAEATLKLDGL